MKTYKCLKCGREIKTIHEDLNDSAITGAFEDTGKMWDGGVVFSMTAGYGSLLDGCMFTGAICDHCLELSAQIESVKYVGDYITGDKKYHPLGKERKDG